MVESNLKKLSTLYKQAQLLSKELDKSLTATSFSFMNALFPPFNRSLSLLNSINKTIQDTLAVCNDSIPAYLPSGTSLKLPICKEVIYDRIYCIIINISYEYRKHVKILSHDLFKITLKNILNLQLKLGKANCPYFKYFPEIDDFCDLSAIKSIIRHARDERYDTLQVHQGGVDFDQVDSLISEFNSINLKNSQNIAHLLTATYPIINDKLLNDPNNDAYLVVEFESGVKLGVVCDGSGSGYHAYLSSLILCSNLYNYAKNATKMHKNHEIFKYLTDIVTTGHKYMVESDECGSCTFCVFLLTNNYFYSLQGGDVELFVVEKHKFKSLLQPPTLLEPLRLQTSFTPGGLGRSHGSRDMINGWYLNDEYLSQLSDIYSNNLDFYCHSNNIHFTQAAVSSDSYFVVSSDGLGDTLDPIQLYPKPYLVYLDQENWQDFKVASNLYDEVYLLRKMKEMILEGILSSLMNPYDTNNTEINPNIILNKLINHAMDVTRLDRELYLKEEYANASRWEKQRIMEQSILSYLDSLSQKSYHRGNQLLEKGVLCAIPTFYIPFCKIDHLGMVVLSSHQLQQ